MLVLSRRIGERIVIDDQIVVTVVEIKGDKVRLGIEAPKEIPIWREELVASPVERELAFAGCGGDFVGGRRDSQ